MNNRMTRLAAAGLMGAFAMASASAQDLNGAGATFPNPIYQKWFSDYAKQTGVKINYQSIGSGGGIKQIQEMTVDFGASDGPMSDQEMAAAKGGPLLHIPTVMGADVLIYNLPEVTSQLRVTPDIIADIFLGKITRWNDKRLAAINPGVKLPNSDVLVVHRSDGSGTTYCWTDYLTKVSPEWARTVGKGKDVKWPVGLGGKGNEGVAGQVKQTPGAVGYVELAYALENKLQHARVRNQAGAFVEPSIASITAAAAGIAKQLPANTDFRISIVDAPGREAYPVSTMTWLLVYQRQPDAEKRKKLVAFLRWMLKNGQQSAESLDYAPLPSNVVATLEKRLNTITTVASR